jgi:hypothetical protein
MCRLTDARRLREQVRYWWRTLHQGRTCLRPSTHPEADRINRAMAAGQSPRSLAGAFKNITRRQLQHHLDVCRVRSPKAMLLLDRGVLTVEDLKLMAQERRARQQEASA